MFRWTSRLAALRRFVSVIVCEFVPTPAELAKAIAAATPVYLPLYRPFPTSLVPPSKTPSLPPVRPSEPLSGDVEAVEAAQPSPVEPSPPAPMRRKKKRRLSVDLRVRLRW